MKKTVYGIIFILPFIIGTIGFYRSGLIIKDSLYNSVSLYFMNMNSDSVNPLIEIARWTAPVMTASGLILAIKNAYCRLRDSFSCMHKDATAVYSDNPNGDLLLGTLKHGISSEQSLVKNVDSHILMFEHDVDNLNFYQTHRDYFEKRQVYMKLETTDSYLLKENRIHFFNTKEIIARTYWLERNLLEYLDTGHPDKKNLSVNIAIIGFEALGQQILRYGLLNNIYSIDQQITYHIFGDSSLYEQVYPAFPMMNRDTIVFHGTDWKSDFPLFSTMDRVILTDEPDLELVQNLLYTCKNTNIDYYSKGNIILENIFKTDLIHGYGRASDIFTEENIKTDRLYHAAMELNYKYACLYGSTKPQNKDQKMKQEWELLDGFTKGSNIASADYHQIRRLVMKHMASCGSELTADELSHGEHIRWCRFHFLNHWTYGVPENGKNKDAVRKIHICLVPYEELPEEEKKKDLEAVELLLSLFPVL